MAADFIRSGFWFEGTTNEILELHARERPNAVALVDARGRLTYGELFAAAQRLAAAFLEQGLTREDVIAIQLPNCNEFAVAINAAMLAGIPFCQIHHGFRSREVEFVLRFIGARAVVVPSTLRGFDYVAMVQALQPSLPKLEVIAVAGEGVPAGCFDLRAALDTPRVLRAPRPHGNDVCRFAFTSGTTGDPKAVTHSYNTSAAAARSSVRDQNVSSDSALLLFLPVGLNWGLGMTKQALISGCKLVYLERFDATEVLRLIERERITHFVTAPASLISVVDAPELAAYDLSSLRNVVSGGASTPVEVLRRARERLPSVRVTEMYGMLETGAQARTALDEDPEAVAGTVGRPIREMQIRVVDDEGREAPAASVGEIVCRGPSVMLGYHHNDEANRRAFTAEGWFRTGDLGFFDAAGRLTIAGRKKEMIIRGGANVYPRELEEVLFTHPKIADAAVVGLPHPTLGETVAACVVLRAGESLTFEELIAFLAPKIAKYKLPEQLACFDAFPRTPTGKVQKGPLAELARAAR